MNTTDFALEPKRAAHEAARPFPVYLLWVGLLQGLAHRCLWRGSPPNTVVLPHRSRCIASMEFRAWRRDGALAHRVFADRCCGGNRYVWRVERGR